MIVIVYLMHYLKQQRMGRQPVEEWIADLILTDQAQELFFDLLSVFLH